MKGQTIGIKSIVGGGVEIWVNAGAPNQRILSELSNEETKRLIEVLQSKVTQ
jgi:hypothetical protein